MAVMMTTSGLIVTPSSSVVVMLAEGLFKHTAAAGTTDGSASDSFSMTDSASGSITAGASASDSFAMSDSASGGVSAGASASDSFSMADSATAGVSAQASASDSLGMSDSADAAVSASGVASDSIAMTDDAIADYAGGTTDRTAEDSFSMSDSAGGGVSTVALLADSFAISDSINASLVVSASVSDSFTVTDSASHVLVVVEPEPIHMQVMEYVRDEIIALNLSYLPAELIAIRKFPWTKDHIYPGLTIHPLRESMGQGTTSKFDVGYGCGLTFVLPTGDGIEEDMGTITGFRQAIRRRFAFSKPALLDTVWQVTVENGDIYIPPRYRDHYDVTTLLLRYWSEEPVYRES